MANMPVSEKNNSIYFKYTNDTGADLDQYTLVLDPDILQVGYIPDPDGILDSAEGLIHSNPGEVMQLTQIAAECSGLTTEQPLYMAPGVGNVHITPVAGDYCIGKLWEDQVSDSYIYAQLIVPFPVDSET